MTHDLDHGAINHDVTFCYITLNKLKVDFIFWNTTKNFFKEEKSCDTFFKHDRLASLPIWYNCKNTACEEFNFQPFKHMLLANKDWII